MRERGPARALDFGEGLANLNVSSNRNPRFALWTLAGRFVLICAIADPDAPDARAAIAALGDQRAPETTRLTALFTSALLTHPDVAPINAARLIFSDSEALNACRLLGAGGEGRWILFDPTLRAVAFWPLAQAQDALGVLNNTPPPEHHAGVPLHAPALIVPRVFEPAFCRTLIDFYTTRGGEPSGITVQDGAGIASVRLNPSFKKRFDCIIEDEKLRDAIMQRIYWRLAPEIEKAFMWRPTRMERYLVACYDAVEGGYFRPHRDNTTNATAHRRFAVTINLNADEYEGGDLRFPEFGARSYRAPTGGAVVFSCAMMHEALPVTRGKRYAFLPFLYDEDAAKVRAANNQFVDNETIRPYGGE
ncbi:MAG: 2OG-Fe(II) oxygenase [Hyphomonadaceae bacterium]|nr:2OG-Fe(II) oxygenase [Hyphomonadaceae bacterium]